MKEFSGIADGKIIGCGKEMGSVCDTGNERHKIAIKPDIWRATNPKVIGVRYESCSLQKRELKVQVPNAEETGIGSREGRDWRREIRSWERRFRS